MALQQGLAHHLVQRVVAADVLAERQQPAGRVEQAARVQAAGLLEHALGGPQGVGQPSDHGSAHDRPRQQARTLQLDVVDGGLAAHAAARCGVEVPLERPGVERTGQADGHHVVALLRQLGLAVADRLDLVAGVDQPFREQEPDRQLEVVAGGPHGDGHALDLLAGAADLDLHGFLGRQTVGAFELLVAAHGKDPLGGGVAAKGVVLLCHGAIIGRSAIPGQAYARSTWSRSRPLAAALPWSRSTACSRASWRTSGRCLPSRCPWRTPQDWSWPVTCSRPSRFLDSTTPRWTASRCAPRIYPAPPRTAP